MTRESTIEQYNAAGAALNDAIEAVRTASDSDLPAAEAAFREAQAEFTRCSSNMEREDELDSIPPFTPRSVPTHPAEIGMDEADVQRFSILRAINAMVQRDWSLAPYEHEISEAVGERIGRRAQGFFLPLEVQLRGFANTELQRRDLVVGTPTAGGDLVATDLLGASFIDMLRNRMVVRAAGATVLGGLVGDVAIPRQTGGATFYWVTEGNPPTESQQAVDQVTMSPKTGGAFTDLSRKLLLQSSIDAEAFVTRDLASTCALGIDYAALHGAGASGQPQGLAGVSGIGSVVCGASGGAPTWSTIIDLETEVAADNADIGNLAYVTNAKVRGKLKKTPIIPTYEADMIWDRLSPDAPLNGYRTLVSNQVRSDITKTTANLSAAFFGNWADLVIGQWGGVDIMVDPYANATAGGVRVIVLQDVDVAVRHAESFSACLDIVTT